MKDSCWPLYDLWQWRYVATRIAVEGAAELGGNEKAAMPV